MKYVICLISLITLYSCSSATVKNIDTTIDSKGSIQNGVVGIKDGAVVIQEERYADEELSLQIWKNAKVRSELEGEYYWLKRCEVERADSRLGGNGQVVKLPDIDSFGVPKKTEELGLDEDGNLRVVKTEDFKTKLLAERQAEQNLTAIIKVVKEQRENCETKMREARLRAGLPGNRIQGRARYDLSGRTVETIQENENSLDDAFRISAQRKPASEHEKTRVSE